MQHRKSNFPTIISDRFLHVTYTTYAHARSFPIGFSRCNNARALMHGFCLEKLKGLYSINLLAKYKVIGSKNFIEK